MLVPQELVWVKSPVVVMLEIVIGTVLKFANLTV